MDHPAQSLCNKAAAPPVSMSTQFDWNDIPLILPLAHSGSMSATARALGMHPSTVSRRVAAAEKALKLRLFIRDDTGALTGRRARGIGPAGAGQGSAGRAAARTVAAQPARRRPHRPLPSGGRLAAELSLRSVAQLCKQ